jgi:hypothetical protein
VDYPAAQRVLSIESMPRRSLNGNPVKTFGFYCIAAVFPGDEGAPSFPRQATDPEPLQRVRPFLGGQFHPLSFAIDVQLRRVFFNRRGVLAGAGLPPMPPFEAAEVEKARAKNGRHVGSGYCRVQLTC